MANRVGRDGRVDLFEYKGLEIRLERRDRPDGRRFDCTFDYDEEGERAVKISTGWLVAESDAIEEACEIIDMLDASNNKKSALQCLWNVQLTDVLGRDCVCLETLPPKQRAMFRSHIENYKTRRAQSRPISNPRQSRVQVALRRMAQNYEDFEDFQDTYWHDCGRGVYWYATRNKNFEMGIPQYALAGGVGLDVWCSPAIALRYAGLGRQDKDVYLAELDLSALRPGKDYQFISEVQEEDGAEFSVGAKILSEAAASKVYVQRVVSEKKARRISRYQTGIVPTSKSELYYAWKFANDPDEVARMDRVEKKRLRRLKREREKGK